MGFVFTLVVVLFASDGTVYKTLSEGPFTESNCHELRSRLLVSFSTPGYVRGRRVSAICVGESRT